MLPPKNKKVYWFLTETGRKFTFYLASATSIGLIGINYVPQTFLLDKYKEIVECYKDGFTVPVTPEVQKRFEKALELANVPKDSRDLYKPFTVFGFDISSAGSCYSRYGGIVGIPSNFYYNSESDIDKRNIKVKQESVNWSSEEGEKLSKALILSERAQIFAISRELEMLKTPKLLLDTFFPASSFMFTYGIAVKANMSFNLYSKPLLARLIIYTLSGMFGMGIYIFLKDFTQVHYETEVDKKLKNRDPMLAEGGKEFYEKIMLRNIALRTLLGKKGESYYSVLGNENYFLRHRHTPLILRSQFFSSNVEES